MELRRLSCSTYGLFVRLFPVLIVCHHTYLTWLIYHIIPTQTVAVEKCDARVCIRRSIGIAEDVLCVDVLTESSLTLSVDEELSLGIVCIDEDGCHLSFTSWPCPVGQHVEGVILLVPLRTIEPVTVLG